jgi:hypothetical protein
LAVALCVLAVSSAAQTRITAPNNKYSPADDVQLGRQAAAQAEQQLPILRDEALTNYVRDVGRRLVDVIPPELRHSEFDYTFKVVNVREINAFALPGGPMYVNRGMIEAAKNEGEVAGVMAHELSHVALRHGTAQASKATKYEIGAIAGQVIGAIIGGNVGSVVAQGSQFGLGAAFMRFSREYERQADLQGAQLMALAGYDPRDMANMFKTIEAQDGGSGLPEWLSDHPDPGNRYEYILREAQALRVTDPIHDTGGFEQARARLKEMPRAPTTAEATRNAENRRRETPGSTTLGRVEPPSNRFVVYRAGTLFQINVPDNWRQLPGSRSVTFAPQGGYVTSGGQSVFTHGVEAGEAPAGGRDVQSATDALITSLAQGNPDLQRSSNYEPANVGDRRGIRVDLSNRSEATGRPERISLYTALLPDGHLFYVVAVSPQEDFSEYQRTFAKVVSSLKLANHR